MMQFTVVIKWKEICFFRSLFYNSVNSYLGFPGVSVVKNLEMQDMQEMWFPSLGQEGPLQEGMATHYSTLAWKAHGQGGLAGYCPLGLKEPERTEETECMHIHT